MVTKPVPKLKLNDRVLVSAPMDSLDAKHNGKIGRITGFVQDWFVVVSIDGLVLRLRPDQVRVC